jgi:hypothetical protein
VLLSCCYVCHSCVARVDVCGIIVVRRYCLVMCDIWVARVDVCSVIILCVISVQLVHMSGAVLLCYV